MNTKLEMAQDRFINGVSKLSESFGLNKFIAQLYAVLYLSDKPLSLDDITEKLRVSKGNVSINIRELEKWGAVKSVWVRGSRKDYYEADLDIKKVFSNKLRLGLQKRLGEVSNMIDEFKTIIESSADDLSVEDKKVAKAYLDRMKKIEELKELASVAMKLAEKFL